MSYRPFRIVSFVEFYLHNQEKLASLTNEQKKFFWRQRDWHPVVRLTWESMMDSNGAGKITFADGSVCEYERKLDMTR